MILRPYQEVAVSAASKALDKYNNTLVVAPTGAGKTIMLSALVGKRYNKCKNVLILQHRDELVNQNMAKFHMVNEGISTSTVNANLKDWDADAVFAMVQTLSRINNLDQMPKMDMVVICFFSASACRLASASLCKVSASDKTVGSSRRAAVRTSS
jgi:DNA repair protein RadD